jgi:hypothetical protein
MESGSSQEPGSVSAGSAGATTGSNAGETRCAECGTRIAAGDERVVTDGGVFCRTCFAALRGEIERVIAAQGADVNYPAAAVGAVLGGMIGALVWWGFTVTTKISFGLVAIVIGVAVAKGAMFFAGGKRSRGLQGLSVAVAGLAFFYASYLVNRTLILREGAGQLPLVPGIGLLVRVVSLGFGTFDLVFLAIVLWEAWRIPAPFKLR